MNYATEQIVNEFVNSILIMVVLEFVVQVNTIAALGVFGTSIMVRGYQFGSVGRRIANK